MAQIPNPRKAFNFSIFIPGLDPFLCQEVDVPEVDIDVVEHGDANFLAKTGGLKKIGTLKVKKIAPATGPDNFIWNWLFGVQNEFTGGGELPTTYQETLVVEQYSNDGVTILDTFVCYNCWPSKVGGVQFRRNASDNSIEEIEFQVERMAR